MPKCEIARRRVGAMAALRLSRVVALGIVLSTAGIPAQSPIVFENLTVPPARLVAGCRLSPSPAVLAATPAVPSNPWRGDDRLLVATIREGITGSPPLPDGPPVSKAELARFRLQLADDVEEAYAATYSDAGANRVTVFAVRFKTGVPDLPRRAAAPRESIRLVRDRTVVVASGLAGPCFQSIAAYL
jgi:hypothetical protein